MDYFPGGSQGGPHCLGDVQPKSWILEIERRKDAEQVGESSWKQVRARVVPDCGQAPS